MTGMVPHDVFELTGVADPRLSPDGATVAYVVGRVDEDANEYRSAVWLAAADGSAPPRRFTSGEKADADPRWSPDGTQLAFTSNRADKASQLYVMPVAGGEPRKLTSLKEDVTQAAWSPDGTRIAFVARVRDADLRGGGRQEAPAAAAHAPAVQARQRRLDGRPAAAPLRGAGRRLRRAHAAHRRRLRRPLAVLVAGRADHRVRLRPSPRLGPRDGQRRVPGGRRRRGAAASHPGRRRRRQRRLAAGRPPRRRAPAPACGTTPGTPRSPSVDAESGEFTLLTASLDRNCSTYPGMREPLWNDGELLFVVEDHGRVHIYAVAADGSGEPRVLVGGEREVTGLDVAAGRLVFTASDPTHLSELYDAGPVAAIEHPAAAGVRLTRRRRRVRRRSRAGQARDVHRRLARRQRRGRLDHAARRLRGGQEVPDPPQHPRRALRPVRRDVLRRVPGVLRRRLRRRLQQPARLVRLHRGLGARHPRPRRGRPAAGAPSTTTTAWPSWTRRSAASTSSTRTASASSAAPTAAT